MPKFLQSELPPAGGVLLAVVAPGTIEATVILVAIRGSSVEYRVVWWVGAERKTEWLDELELSSEPKSMRVQIGFSPTNR